MRTTNAIDASGRGNRLSVQENLEYVLRDVQDQSQGRVNDQRSRVSRHVSAHGARCDDKPREAMPIFWPKKGRHGRANNCGSEWAQGSGRWAWMSYNDATIHFVRTTYIGRLSVMRHVQRMCVYNKGTGLKNRRYSGPRGSACCF